MASQSLGFPPLKKIRIIPNPSVTITHDEISFIKTTK
jgi:hypothetical protein